MRKILTSTFFCKAILTFVLMPAAIFAGSVTYTYTGNPFTTVAGNVQSGDFLSISIILPTALLANQTDEVVTPLSWSISDGVAADLLTNTNHTYSFQGFEFATNAAGSITGWGIGANTYPGTVQTFSATTGNWTLLGNQTATHDLFYETLTAFSINLSHPGTWAATASSTTIPEPSTGLSVALPLFLAGCCAAIKRRSEKT